MDKITCIGVGLIGGSMALELQQLFPEATLLGMDKSETNLQEAITLGLIHGAANENDLQTSQLVVISVPVSEIVKELPELLHKVGNQTLVIDMGSTKETICESVKNHPKRHQFLAAHPIAGTEFSGAKAAFLGLFKGKTMIVCEVEKTIFKLQEKALEIFANIGMRIRYMNPKQHDIHIAYVSHLSHILSYMLGKTVMEKSESESDIFDMAGSGFESTVRLAKSSASMWVPIFQHNKDFVLESLNNYIDNLQQFKTLLENNEFDQVFKELYQINHIREILEGKFKK